MERKYIYGGVALVVIIFIVASIAVTIPVAINAICVAIVLVAIVVFGANGVRLYTAITVIAWERVVSI